MTQFSEDFDDPIRTVGHDVTSTFDDTASNPTEHASSEALSSATDVDDEADPVSASDDAVEPVTNSLEGADEEAPVDGEYLSEPGNSVATADDLEDDDLEDDDDDDDDDELEDDEEETDEADEAELDTDELEDEDDALDGDADLDSGSSPQANVGKGKAGV